MFCENRNGTILSGGCFDGRQQVILRVVYSHVEADELRLCRRCAARISNDAHRHGYIVYGKELEDERAR